jgi:hypothetical protein
VNVPLIKVTLSLEKSDRDSAPKMKTMTVTAAHVPFNSKELGGILLATVQI